MFERFRHQRHEDRLIRYAGELQGASAPPPIPANWDRCPLCREEVHRLIDAHSALGDEAGSGNGFYRQAVRVLARMHRTDGFRRALLPDADIVHPRFQPALRFALSAAAALILLALPALMLLPPGGEAPVQVASRPAAIQADPSAPPAPQPAAIQPPEAAPLPAVVASPEPAPAPRRVVVARTHAPVVETPSRDPQVESAEMVVMIHYLSGNITNGNSPVWDLNDSGASDAVDLAMMLNLSVQNIAPKSVPHS